MYVGEIVHKLRKERKLTLAELSKKSGVAIATLSRIENGKMTGTLDSHISICKALEINLPELYRLFSDGSKKVETRAKKTSAEVLVHDKKSFSEMLVSGTSGKKMMPIVLKISKVGATRKEETKPGVERFVYILDGKIEAHVGDTTYTLNKGDTLYFESSLPHFFKNLSSGESHLLSVTCPPIL